MSDKNKEYWNKIREEISIQDVCEELGIKAKKQGQSYVALCPFHEDHHPSMSLYQNKYYHCFACGAKGDIFRLIGQVKGCEFIDSVIWIEEHFSKVLQFKPAVSNRRKEIAVKTGLERAFKCYSGLSPNKLEAFAKNRRFDVSFLHNQGVFYVSANTLTKKFHMDSEAMDQLASDRMVIPKAIQQITLEDTLNNLQYHDSFAGDRVIFAIHDLKGRISGFAARALDDTTRPKYQFNQGFQKSAVLYGLNRAVQEFEKQKDGDTFELYLVEGFMDVLRLESLGMQVAAVMGSGLASGQLEVLGEVAAKANRRKIGFSIHLFLDSDKAGMIGTMRTLRSLLAASELREVFVDVVLNTDIFGCKRLESAVSNTATCKDPDELFREGLRRDQNGKQTEMDPEQWITEHRLSLFEFIVRFLYKQDTLAYDLAFDEFGNYFDQLSPSDKIRLLSKTKSLFNEKQWLVIMNRYEPIDGNLSAYQLIYRFLNPLDSSHKSSQKKEKSKDKQICSTDYSLWNEALTVARNSYVREPIPLDDFTWDRIQMCGDVYYAYLSQRLKARTKPETPMLAIRYPKNSESIRLKALYAQDDLILQQYVLNELLRERTNLDFYQLIPAVRYVSGEGGQSSIQTTGNQMYPFFADSETPAVSFAYQIDMASINGIRTRDNGMFRPYYECWRSFIQFLDDGIRHLNGEWVYRVRLDIRRYYDSISRSKVRQFLKSQLPKALSVDETVLNEFFEGQSLVLENQELTYNEKANRLTDWIVQQLFGIPYIDPQDGGRREPSKSLQGIPQGPNLSAYVANILLFDLDRRLLEYVEKVNKEERLKSGNDQVIAIRYARYVDDMVILSNDKAYLNKAYDLIEQELYVLGLQLSPKTDGLHAVGKDDAQEWLISERGGLGVSAGSDRLDDNMVDLLRESIGMDSADRRSTLKVLRQWEFSFDQMGRKTEEQERETIIEHLFKTEEIRYQDIVRFSETLLRCYVEKAVDEQAPELRKERTLYDFFYEDWQKHLHLAPSSSLFRRSGILQMAFLDGMKGLMKPERGSLSSEKMRWERRKLICARKWLEQEVNLPQIFDWNIYTPDNLFLQNQFVETLNYVQIICAILTQYRYFFANSKELEQNIFTNEWRGNLDWSIRANCYTRFGEYALWACCSDDLQKKIDVLREENITQIEKDSELFHFVVSFLLLSSGETSGEKENKWEELKEILSEPFERIRKTAVDLHEVISQNQGEENYNAEAVIGKEYDFVLTSCLLLWFKGESAEKGQTKGERDRIRETVRRFHKGSLLPVLSVLLNIMDREVITDFLNQNFFLLSQLVPSQERKGIRFLPSPPSCGQPGIFAYHIKNQETEIHCFDFKGESRLADNGLNWIEQPLPRGIDESQLRYRTCQLKGEWFSLKDVVTDEFCTGYVAGRNTIQHPAEKMACIFQVLCDRIEALEREHPIVPSVFHVFCQRKNLEEIHILSFLLDDEKARRQVAKRVAGKSHLQLMEVADTESTYHWKAGALLADLAGYDSNKREFDDQDPRAFRWNQVRDDALKRLRGDVLAKFPSQGSEKSVKATVDRTILNLKQFATCSSVIESERERTEILFILNMKVTNHLIRKQMNSAATAHFNDDLPGLLARWVSECCQLLKDVRWREFVKSVSGVGVGSEPLENEPLRRNVWAYWRLGERLEQLVGGKDTWAQGEVSPTMGISLMGHALLLNAVCVNIRCQVQELTQSFSDKQKDKLISSSVPNYPEWDLSQAVLGGDDPQQALSQFGFDLLEGKEYRCELAPVGWLFLLRWLFDAFLKMQSTGDTTDEKITCVEMADWNKLYESLILTEQADEKYGYPFEAAASYLLKWSKDQANERLNILEKIDRKIGIKVRKIQSVYFSWDLPRVAKGGRLRLNLAGRNLGNKPLFFFTDTAWDKSDQRECDPSNHDCFVWTESRIGEEIVGGAGIREPLADLVRGNFSDQKQQVITDSESINSADAEDFIEIPKEQKLLRACPKENHEEAKKEGKEREKEDGWDAELFKSKVINCLQGFQRNSWETQKKLFQDYDRIALLQMDVDNSYEHPLLELCAYNADGSNTGSVNNWAKEVRRQPALWTEKEIEAHDGNVMWHSCAEWRRRKILERVFETCTAFDVDILLLPEYSIRPETVTWIRDCLEMEKYSFSVWAGTFRIVPGYGNQDKEIQDAVNGEDKAWAAMLPVVLGTSPLYRKINAGSVDKASNDLKGDQIRKSEQPAEREGILRIPRILTRRFKKYPSIAMKEMIQYPGDKTLESILSAEFGDYQFASALDHITELICAEMFLISSPSNISSFAAALWELKKKFGFSTPVDQVKRWIQEDIMKFGDRTAIYKLFENDYYKTKGAAKERGRVESRKSIILVPAYTSRAADYYVTGQAGYLASGLTTVFCNAVGMNTIGGSCFVGTNSWDHYVQKPADYMPSDSPYQGIYPGVFQQSSSDRTRGALGKSEQALLICDVDPRFGNVGKPRAQAMREPLVLVAHLPIIESHYYPNSGGAERYLKCRCERASLRSINKMSCLICPEVNGCSFCDDAIVGLYELLEVIKHGLDVGSNNTTISIPLIQNGGKALQRIGRAIQSDWLVKRGKRYEEQHINDPDRWPARTLLDWIWVDLEFEKRDLSRFLKMPFAENRLEKKDEFALIEMPVFRKLSGDKGIADAEKKLSGINDGEV